jgi:hypothetical protein
MRRASALILALSLGACRPALEEDLKPPPGFKPPPVYIPRAVPLHTDVPSLRGGFFGRETDGQGHFWTWMGGRGEIAIPRAPGGARLRIVGWVPREFLAAAPQLRVTLAGPASKRELERFTAETEVVKEWDLPDEIVGSGPSTLVIETSAVGKAPGDPRSLGFSIRTLEWRLLRP